MTFPMDGTLPKDVISLNPHFNGDNADALLAALQANLNSWAPTAGTPYTLRAYDANQLPPSYPLATRTQSGTPPTSSAPREVALCLSYYTTWNRPRYRGRLYLPNKWLPGTLGIRPTATQRDTVIGFATSVLTKSLPPATNWVVWSKTERKSQGGVSNIWVDDEWDTVRTRGLKSTTRTLATVP
jgi:hypothetical protein